MKLMGKSLTVVAAVLAIAGVGCRNASTSGEGMDQTTSAAPAVETPTYPMPETVTASSNTPTGMAPKTEAAPAAATPKPR